MASYVFRRLLLMLPTLFGIMLISFVIIQFVPGGPVERMMAQLQGHNIDATAGFSGGGNADLAMTQSAVGQTGKYRGAQGLDPEFIKQLEKMYGFDKPAPERFWIMVKNYATFNLGQSYYRDVSVIHLVLEKMPVSISLGLWSTLIIYLISIPLGIKKAVRDNWREMSFPRLALDYAWHMTLPVIAMVISGFASLTLLTKNSFMDEIGKQYVLTARAKGLSEKQVLYGHVFRNAMLIVIAGFPAAFISIFFTGALLIEVIFSLDGLGLLGYESVINRDYPVVLGTLYIYALIGLVMTLVRDLIYVLVDPRIDFEARAV